MQSTNSRTLILILVSKFFGKKTYQLSCLFRARLIETYFECWIHSLNVSDLPLTRKSPKKMHWQSPKGYIYLYAYIYIYTYVHNNDIYVTLQYTKLILLLGAAKPSVAWLLDCSRKLRFAAMASLNFCRPWWFVTVGTLTRRTPLVETSPTVEFVPHHPWEFFQTCSSAEARDTFRKTLENMD